MRVVGGKHRGRKLKAPTNQVTRPTSDRTREAVCNILGARLINGFHGLTVADLFAGTGALALEALSRGAVHAIAVENDREAIKIIDENAQMIEEAQNLTLLKWDATKLGALPPQINSIDLVFLDPPYGKDLVIQALQSLVKNTWLSENALCIVETSNKEALEFPEEFDLVDRRKYGKAAVHFLEFSR